MKTLFISFVAVLFTLPNIGFSAECEWAPLLEAYHGVSLELANDRFPGTREVALQLANGIDEWVNAGCTAKEDTLLRELGQNARRLSSLSDEKEIRKAYGPVSNMATKLVKARADLQSKWQLFYCPMADGFRYWMQPKAETMMNPYMGLEMLQCGVKKAWSALP